MKSSILAYKLVSVTIFIVLLIATIIAEGQLTAQKVPIKDMMPEHFIVLNLYGDASVFSLHYDRQSALKEGAFFSTKLGIGYNEEWRICALSSCTSPPARYMTVPHHITYNTGFNKHYFEIGMGATLLTYPATQNYIVYPILGYRRVPAEEKRFQFRVFGQIPFTGLDTKDILFVPLGLSLGIRLD